MMTEANLQHEARYYEKLPDQVVRCLLCPHRCRITPGRSGLCMGRVNHDGRLIAESYGCLTSIALDPIEKKPLRRFYPGSYILSVGSYGCNLRCSFCQNWQISQRKADWQYIAPPELVRMAIQQIPRGNIGLAFTYNEPLITFEYVLDCCQAARAAGLKTVLVTNGLINPEPMAELLPWVDAMNIDLKAFRPDFYRRICRGELADVQKIIALCVPACHVEITTLLIPGLNDADQEIEDLASWLASLASPVTLHLTRHHPDYQMPQPPPISLARMKHLAELAGRHLPDVLLGNV